MSHKQEREDLELGIGQESRRGPSDGAASDDLTSRIDPDLRTYDVACWINHTGKNCLPNPRFSIAQSGTVYIQ